MRVKDVDFQRHSAAHFGVVLYESLNQLHIVFSLVVLTDISPGFGIQPDDPVHYFFQLVIIDIQPPLDLFIVFFGKLVEVLVDEIKVVGISRFLPGQERAAQRTDLLELRVSDLEDAPEIRQTLESTLGPGYILQDWTELNEPLYQALWLEKVAISLTIGLIIMVAALNIVASLVLLVMEKSRDIAILRTMGAPAAMIRRVFVYQGFAIGLVGTVTGTVLGLAVCYVADRYRLISLPSEVYQITYLPFRVEPFDVTVVFVSAVLVCLLATLYPSRQAGRLDPAEALRNQ